MVSAVGPGCRFRLHVATHLRRRLFPCYRTRRTATNLSTQTVNGKHSSGGQRRAAYLQHRPRLTAPLNIFCTASPAFSLQYGTIKCSGVFETVSIPAAPRAPRRPARRTSAPRPAFGAWTAAAALQACASRCRVGNQSKHCPERICILHIITCILQWRVIQRAAGWGARHSPFVCSYFIHPC